MTAAATSEEASEETEHAVPPQSSVPDANPALGVVPPGIHRLVLIGFMGAGKSTVGQVLAGRLGWGLIDTDLAIQAKAGMPPGEIFASLGEFVFRRMETSAIAHALGERNAVIALGGGAPEVLANRLLLEQTPQTAVIFLQAAFSTLLDRCHHQDGAALRPNLVDIAAAEERFRYRAPLYRRCARYLVETEGRTSGETADALLLSLSTSGRSQPSSPAARR